MDGVEDDDTEAIGLGFGSSEGDMAADDVIGLAGAWGVHILEKADA